jgi:hypothetical protein
MVGVLNPSNDTASYKTLNAYTQAAAQVPISDSPGDYPPARFDGTSTSPPSYTANTWGNLTANMSDPSTSVTGPQESQTAGAGTGLVGGAEGQDTQNGMSKVSSGVVIGSSVGGAIVVLVAIFLFVVVRRSKLNKRGSRFPDMAGLRGL